MLTKKLLTGGAVALMLFTGAALPSPAAAKDSKNDIVATVASGCKTELDNYCKDVTPGDGRILACLYARNDKLSSRCEYALYDASVQLERAVTALSYLANECHDDLAAMCSGTRPGEGRLLKCLGDHSDKVSDRCREAINDVKIQ